MRPTIDETWLRVAAALAMRGTCAKMQVGCVLADAQGNLLAANYNGVAAGEPHCNEVVRIGADFKDLGGGVSMPRKMVNSWPHRCKGANAPAGSDLCEAVHAEQNALTRCLLPGSIHTCYLWKMSPCMRCTKQLLNTPCARIVFLEEYTREPQARELWTRPRPGWPDGREWLLHPPLK